ncbi:hypothetical protein BD769DRAFT_1393941 [Suillus cothurnatus]|nr:hypothetical protein BD769DRAFT_1393941 [Suillus cothurnatus]
MPSQHESNKALALADKSLHDSLCRIKCWQADGHSQALQQHGRNCSVISPFLLSAAAKIQETMNQGLAPQWSCVRVDDPRMESHPFSLRPFDMDNQGQHQHQHQHQHQWSPQSHPQLPNRSREDSPGAESGRKKHKVSKPLSKAILSDTEDEDRPSKVVELSPAALPESKRMTKTIKQAKVAPNVDRAQPKAKGKKAEDSTEPVRGHELLKATPKQCNPPCKRCTEGPCLVVVGRKGHTIKSCAKCHNMKVWCSQPVLADANSPATMSSEELKPRPRSKPAPVSKSKPRSRTTRATSRAHPPTPTIESEEDVEEPDVPVTDIDNAKMDCEVNTKQHNDITAEMSVVADDQIMADQPAAITSADDFPAEHWLEDTDDIPILIPPPTPVADHLSLASEPSSPTIRQRLLALMSQVTVMQIANDYAVTRMDAMEHEFDTCISLMHAELSSMQLDVSTTVTLVNGLVCIVEKLRQECILPNPSFPPPAIRYGNESLATAFGMRYLNGVYGPSVAPVTLSAGVSQTSVSRPSGRSDMQGTTLASSSASSASRHASPSSAPAAGELHLAVVSPPPAQHSLP